MPSTLLSLLATSVNRGEQQQEEHGKGNTLTISAPTALIRRLDPSPLEGDVIVVVDNSEEGDEQISQSSSVGGDVVVTATGESMSATVAPPASIQALLEDDRVGHHHITSSPSSKGASPTISQLYNIVECISERNSVGDDEIGAYPLIKSDASTTAAFTVSAPPALISRHQQQQQCDDNNEELSTSALWSWKKHDDIGSHEHSGAYEALLSVPVSVASQLDPSSLPSADSFAKWFHHRTTLLKLSELMEDQVILTDPSNTSVGGEGEVGGIARRTLTTSTAATTSSYLSTYQHCNDGIVLPSTTRISCPASFDEEDYRVSFDDGVAHCLFHHPIRRSSSASSSSPRVADPLLFTDPDAPPMVLVREDEDEEKEDVGSNTSYLHIDDDDDNDEGEVVRVCSHHHAHTLGDVCNPPSAAARLLTPPPSSCPASPAEARLPLAVQLRDTSSSPPSTPPFSPFEQMYPPVEECSPALHVDPYHHPRPHHQHRTQSSFVNTTPRQRRMSKSAGCASCSSSSGRCAGMVPPAALIPRGTTDQMEDSIPLFESQMDNGFVGWDGWSLGGGGILIPSSQHHHSNNNSRETATTTPATTSVYSTSILEHGGDDDGVVPTSPRMGRRETRPMSHYVDHPLLLNDDDLAHRRATSPRRGAECGTSPDHASFPLTSIIHHPRPNNNNGHPSSSRRHRSSCATSIGHCILGNSLTSFSTDGATTNTNSVSFGRFSHQDDHHQHPHSHQQQPRRSLGAISALSASHTPTAAGNIRSRYSSPSNAAAVTPIVSVQWLHW